MRAGVSVELNRAPPGEFRGTRDLKSEFWPRILPRLAGGKLKEAGMRSMITVAVVFCVVAIGGGCATLQPKGPADIVAEGCKTEIETYCKSVTPGEGRVLACLYAYNDKLSNRCEYALYDASAQLERVVAALAYVANECRDDLNTYCSNIQPGEGRLLECLDKNKAKVSSRRKQAQKDIGLK